SAHPKQRSDLELPLDTDAEKQPTPPGSPAGLAAAVQAALLYEEYVQPRLLLLALVVAVFPV
ncbi:hypothetical protein H6F86_01955, partial [Phormidium sp. FACHB-592]